MLISESLCLSNLKCYPWLETDASAAGCLVGLYAQFTDTLHHKFRGRSARVLLCSHLSECLSAAILCRFYCLRLFKTCVLVRCRSFAPWSEGSSLAMYDAVLWELHLAPYTRVPPLPVPHAPPQPALETPAPRHSAHGAALQCETLNPLTPNPWPPNTAHWSRNARHRGAC